MKTKFFLALMMGAFLSHAPELPEELKIARIKSFTGTLSLVVANGEELKALEEQIGGTLESSEPLSLEQRENLSKLFKEDLKGAENIISLSERGLHYLNFKAKVRLETGLVFFRNFTSAANPVSTQILTEENVASLLDSSVKKVDRDALSECSGCADITRF